MCAATPTDVSLGEGVGGQCTGESYTTILSLEFKGDLEAFLDLWDHTLMALPKMPDEELLLTLLEAQLRKVKSLTTTFLTYDLADEGSEVLTSAWLYNAARKQVAKEQRLKTKQQLIDGTAKALAARPGDPKGKGKKGEKGKGKGDGKDKKGGPPPDMKHIMCQQWQSRGSCSFGDRCRFSHADPPTAPTAPAAQPPQSAAICSESPVAQPPAVCSDLL